MCGIAGVFDSRALVDIDDAVLFQMIELLRHRGPDESGVYRDDHAAMISTRLSIVDLAAGQQPIGNEDGTSWIVFNGEIYNYRELRDELLALGHQFETECDTEVVLHLYEAFGPDCLGKLNGQFAIAIWDSTERTLFLARDRIGIRPLFYAQDGDRVAFGSEIKALLAVPGIDARIDSQALAQVFTFWAPLTPRTIFQGIYQLPPGHFMVVHGGEIVIECYWSPQFEPEPARSADEYLEEFRFLLGDAVRRRMQADVPVGGYLSGGLDSSVTSALALQASSGPFDTFSISFADRAYDESAHQRSMAEFLGTNHQELTVTDQDIAGAFGDVLWHTETPVLRTAPAPMFLLSRLAHDHGYKVVLTGEGADEILAGYAIFKEMRVRRFWAKNPASTLRPLLLNHLYPDIPRATSTEAFARAFFGRDLQNVDSPYYSHMIRWSNTGRLTRFLSEGHARDAVAKLSMLPPIPDEATGWSDLGMAQYLEMTTFLSPYLLSSQGDRASMAHSVEGRYPFLDHRLVEFCGRLPAEHKLLGLREKRLLKKLGAELVPASNWQRTKRPYRAPIQRTFFPEKGPDESVMELLSPHSVRQAGHFKPAAVNRLQTKASSGSHLSETEEMGLVGILSMQWIQRLFVEHQFSQPSEGAPADLKHIDRRTASVSEARTRR
ncbi:MAG: asparagine synthase (glutamine-hydrolyzing) [Anaerolineales bacterium]